MLGQHPQMYGLPETHLLCAETMVEWSSVCRAALAAEADDPSLPHPFRGARIHVDHGLLRAVAQLWFNGQTEPAVTLASEWLDHRSNLTTGEILKLLAKEVYPRILVDKSPSITYRPEFLQRAYRMFPEARFIHLVRHPRGHGESVIKYLRALQRLGPVPASHWLFRLASFPDLPPSGNGVPRPTELDPQRGWYVLNKNICEFLDSVPDSQKKRVIGEELMAKPDLVLREVAAWMGLRTDSVAIDEMKHPERSPYARFGPPSARYGNDHFFLKRPMFHPNGAKQYRLDGPVVWLKNGEGLLPEVKQLAREFGYE